MSYFKISQSNTLSMFNMFVYFFIIIFSINCFQQSEAKRNDDGSDDVEKIQKTESQRNGRDKSKTPLQSPHLLDILNNLPFLKKDKTKKPTSLTSESFDSEYADELKATVKDKSDISPGRAVTLTKGKKHDNAENEKQRNNRIPSADDSLSVTFFRLLHGQRNVKTMFKTGDFWHAWKISHHGRRGDARQLSYYSCQELAHQCSAEKWERIPRLSLCSFHLDSIEGQDQVCVFPFGEVPEVGGDCDGGIVMSISLLLEECGPTIRTLWRLRKDKNKVRKASSPNAKPVLLNDVICNGETLCLFNTVYEIHQSNIRFYVKDKAGEVLYVHEMPMKKSQRMMDGSPEMNGVAVKMNHSNETDESLL